MELTSLNAARARHHADEAERLLAAAGMTIFKFEWPMVNTREQALMRAGANASLALYYATANPPSEE